MNRISTLSSATLSCVKRGTTPFTFQILAFRDVILTSYYVTPDATNGASLDLVHMKYSQLTHRWVPQNPNGTAGTAITTTFNYKTSRAG